VKLLAKRLKSQTTTKFLTLPKNLFLQRRWRERDNPWSAMYTPMCLVLTVHPKRQQWLKKWYHVKPLKTLFRYWSRKRKQCMQKSRKCCRCVNYTTETIRTVLLNFSLVKKKTKKKTTLGSTTKTQRTTFACALGPRIWLKRISKCLFAMVAVRTDIFYAPMGFVSSKTSIILSHSECGSILGQTKLEWSKNALHRRTKTPTRSAKY
jgi:hypothetical protein